MNRSRPTNPQSTLTGGQAAARQNMPMPKPPRAESPTAKPPRGRRAPAGRGIAISIDGLSLEDRLLGTDAAAMPTLATLGSIETMRATVAMARALVEGGRDIDLAGLEHDAAAICQALDRLPAGSARAMRPAMLALMREVEALAIIMPAQ